MIIWPRNTGKHAVVLGRILELHRNTGRNKTRLFQLQFSWIPSDFNLRFIVFMGAYFQRILDFWNIIFMFLHYRKAHIFHTRSTAAVFYEPLDLQSILGNRQKCEYSDKLCYTQTCWTTWWEVHIAVFIAPCRLLHGEVLRIAPIKRVCLYLVLSVSLWDCM